MKKELGKIKSVEFGYTGYQEQCLGIDIVLSFNGGISGCVYSKSFWDYNLIEWTDRCQWTEKDRDLQAVEIMRYISDLLKAANVTSIDKLAGIPIEAEFEKNTIKSFRILQEVL